MKCKIYGGLTDSFWNKLFRKNISEILTFESQPFDFCYQLLVTIFNNIDEFENHNVLLSKMIDGARYHVCAKDPHFTRIREFRSELRNYIMFTLAKQGNFNIIQQIVNFLDDKEIFNEQNFMNAHRRNRDYVDHNTDNTVNLRMNPIDTYMFYNGSCFDKRKKLQFQYFKPIQIAFHFKQCKCLEWMYQCDKFIENDTLD